MDMFNQSYTNYQTPPRQRSERMEIASLILGGIAMISCLCLYLAIPCGALAIIFATLSRGGQMNYGSKAQLGMALGIIALVFTIVIYGVSFGIALYQYGSIDGILRAYSDMTGISYNELIQQLYPNMN